jgi:hypothetical protein
MGKLVNADAQFASPTKKSVVEHILELKKPLVRLKLNGTWQNDAEFAISEKNRAVALSV